ncbi:unnamed protein product [Periconia digitata]|uniref:Mmc1 C-terminal domain-containing protein n=1 Tax=Periconia digitata TaxID=1303443 RepID=A0A9W4U593_9PLEO|nr:unnamed protein product [Periconia digitata]
MPPWVGLVPRCTSSCREIAIEQYAHAIRSFNITQLRRPLGLRVRSASTHISPTAINYRPIVPRRNTELYEALQKLGKDAEQFNNLRRLQLALRGLEVEGDAAVTRVAVLGLNSQGGAQRLARLLLADPLGKEEDWEKELNKPTEGDDSAVLIRFGDEHDMHAPNPLYKTISIPSRILGRYNLELLVSTLNVDAGRNLTPTTERPDEAILVPKLRNPSHSGVPVPWPVHKTLIFGEGLDSAIAFGSFWPDNGENTEGLVKVAVNLPPPSEEVEADQEALSTPVNVDVGTEALDSIRDSVQNSLLYERKWFASNLPPLSKWLIDNVETKSISPIKPIHRSLIGSLVDETEANITRADAQQLAILTAPTTTTQEQVNAEMIVYLESWAEKGHEELRDSLDEGFHGRSWKRLAWWKLWWRVDDVGMVLEEIVQRRWLVKTEKDAIYLAGRMSQAGFPEDTLPQLDQQENSAIVLDPVSAETPAQPEPLPTSSSTTPEPHTLQTPTSSTTTTNETNLSTEIKLQVPWPNLISTARTTLLSTTLPPLQSLAQRLLITTLSTTTTSTALSALLYMSIPSLSLFEASAVAVLGLTISLRRMQRVWEDAREEWQRRVREEGRQTLKGVEVDVRDVIGRKGKKVGGVLEDEGVRERKSAREAVVAVREALERLEK